MQKSYDMILILGLLLLRCTQLRPVRKIGLSSFLQFCRFPIQATPSDSEFSCSCCFNAPKFSHVSPFLFTGWRSKNVFSTSSSLWPTKFSLHPNPAVFVISYLFNPLDALVLYLWSLLLAHPSPPLPRPQTVVFAMHHLIFGMQKTLDYVSDYELESTCKDAPFRCKFRQRRSIPWPDFLLESKISAIWRRFPLIFAFYMLNVRHISTSGLFHLVA